ncbi:MAG: hypothetical protein ACYDEY_06905 [Acidimicrobiales bacterium]
MNATEDATFEEDLANDAIEIVSVFSAGNKAFFVQFEDDECITRDVDEAVEAPVHIAVVLATRCELSVVAAVALTARHDKRIASRIARRCDQPVWLRNAASRIAGMA